MARRVAVGCALTALVALAFLPARAASPKNGTIVAATASSPAAARMAFVLNNYDNVGDEPSGTYVLGYVTRIPVDSIYFKVGPALAGSVGDFDIFFYAAASDGDYPGAALPNETTADTWAHPGPSCDRLPTGAKWAIVTLAVGAADQFALSFGDAPFGPPPNC